MVEPTVENNITDGYVGGILYTGFEGGSGWNHGGKTRECCEVTEDKMVKVLQEMYIL